MYVLGKAYFWKLLESCSDAWLWDYAESVRSVLVQTTGKDFKLVQPEEATREKIRRWSNGCFQGQQQLALKFPRVLYVYRAESPDGNERWTLDVFFTRIPHIKGIYSKRLNNHTIDVSVERELSTRMVESYLADVFARISDNTLVGSAAGIYLHQKLQNVPSLKAYAETSRYGPPGSDLKELLEVVPAILPETGPSSTVMELPNKRSRRKEFLNSCDQRIVAALGKARLEAILRPTEISADKWLSAGKRHLW